MAEPSEAYSSERERLEQSIAALSAQRAVLGDEATDAAISAIRHEISALEESESKARAWKEGERRVVTVLFSDVVGSTSLAEKLDPEEWTGIMNTIFERLMEPVERYGGTVARLMGDAILAFFGAPVAHEDDPQRAVLAGLAILENIRPLREKLLAEDELNFDVRVGINTGLAVVGDVGSDAAAEYTAMGDAVNVAARMEQTAKPGTVQIAGGTYKLVAPYFDIRPVGGVAVKGKREPVEAYQVLGESTQPSPVRGLAAHGIQSPLVGRENELAAARDAVARLRDGQGGILFIFGEAGIGKSRLLAELFEKAGPASLSGPSDLGEGEHEPQEQNLQWLEGQAQAFGQVISFWPLREILKAFAGIAEEDNDRAAWFKLEASVKDLFSEKTAEVLPYLASALNLEVIDAYAERVKYLDSQAMGEQITLAFGDLFRELSARKPLVLVFEDLHWVDSSSARLLERLLPLVETSPLLICGLSRPVPDSPALLLGELAAREYESCFTELRLSPLSQGDSKRLVHNLLEIDDLPPRVREIIVSKADGNPFFLEEVIRNLIEAGVVVRDPSSDRWRATGEIAELAIPDTIQGVIMARIDRLDEAVKGVLRAAAVIGRVFLIRILNQVVGDGEAADSMLERHLVQLASVELIREKSRLPELEYIFKHALARDATYESILLKRRRSLHARAGQAIETIYADRLEEFYGLLAHHYTAAGNWEKAQHYLFQVGDQAQGMAADTEALAHYQQAIAAYEQAFGEPMAPDQRASVERKMGDAYFRLGHVDESWALLSSAVALIDRAVPDRRLAAALAAVGQIIRQVMHRLWPGKFIGKAQEHKKEAAREALLAHIRLGQLAYMKSGSALVMLYFGLRSLNLAEISGYPQDMVRGYAIAALAGAATGSLKLADYYMSLARVVDRKHDDESAHALFLNFWGANRMGGCRWDPAAEALAAAAEVNQRIGIYVERDNALNNLAFVLQKTGRPEKVRQIRNDVLASAERRDDQQMIIWTLFFMVEDTLRTGAPGHVEESFSLLDRAQKFLTDIPNKHDEILTQCLMAQAHYRRGDLDAARQAAETAIRLIRTERPLLYPYFTDALAGLASVTLSLWEATASADGQKLAADALKIVSGMARPTAVYLKPRIALYQGTISWLSSRQRSAKKSWTRSLALAEQFGMPYDRGLAHFEIGRHLLNSDPDGEKHLHRAAEIFSQVGSVWNLAQVNEILGQP